MLGAEPGASRKAASECSYVLSHLSTPEALIDLFSAVLCMEHAHCAVPVGQELCPGLCLLASPWRTLASCLLLSYSPSPGRGVLCYHFYLLLCVHDVCVCGVDCHGTCVAGRGQLCESVLSFHFYWVLGINLGHLACAPKQLY